MKFFNIYWDLKYRNHITFGSFSEYRRIIRLKSSLNQVGESGERNQSNGKKLVKKQMGRVYICGRKAGYCIEFSYRRRSLMDSITGKNYTKAGSSTPNNEPVLTGPDIVICYFNVSSR